MRAQLTHRHDPSDLQAPESWEPDLQRRLTDPHDRSALLELYDRTAAAAYSYALLRTADPVTARQVCLEVYIDIFQMPAILFGGGSSVSMRILVLVDLRTESPAIATQPGRSRLARLRGSGLQRGRIPHGRRPSRAVVALPGQVPSG